MDKRNVKKREVWSSGQRRDLAPSDVEDSDGANLLLIFIGIHIKVEGMFAWEPWAENGTLYLCCNPELDGKTYTITVDGAEVQPSFDMGINGDGVYVIWVDVSGMSAGSHTVTVTADGTATFTIE